MEDTNKGDRPDTFISFEPGAEVPISFRVPVYIVIMLTVLVGGPNLLAKLEPIWPQIKDFKDTLISLMIFVAMGSMSLVRIWLSPRPSWLFRFSDAEIEYWQPKGRRRVHHRFPIFVPASASGESVSIMVAGESLDLPSYYCAYSGHPAAAKPGFGITSKLTHHYRLGVEDDRLIMIEKTQVSENEFRERRIW